MKQVEIKSPLKTFWTIQGDGAKSHCIYIYIYMSMAFVLFDTIWNDYGNKPKSPEKSKDTVLDYYNIK